MVVSHLRELRLTLAECEALSIVPPPYAFSIMLMNNCSEFVGVL